MMSKKLLFTCIAMLTAGFIFTGCKDGEIGPQGPAGPAGPQGANGANGAAGGTGQTGQTGSANVIYSPWINIPKGEFQDNNWVYSISAPGLNKDVIDKGVILTFLGIEGQLALALPCTESNPNGGAISYFTTASATGSFALYTRWVGATFPSNWATNGLPGLLAAGKFRYVIIPGAVKTAMKPGVDLKDYNQVTKYFNIPL